MSGSGNTTADDPIERPGRETLPGRPEIALVKLYSRYEPERIGQIAFVTEGEPRGFILGRPEDVRSSRDPNLLRFQMQRPGVLIDGGPLAGKNISRRELFLQSVDGGLELEHLGKAILLIDGKRIESRDVLRLEVGSIITLVDHSMYLVVKRSRVMQGWEPEPGHVFGEPDPDGIAGESPAAWKLRTEIRQAKLAGGHVMGFGQSGTGKELLAKAVHRLWGRRGKLIPFNAAKFTPELAANMLEGNRAAYPNPGMQFNPGLIGEAEGGTLHLDEFAWSKPEVQAGLLRGLEGQILRQGEAVPRSCDVIFVLTTNLDSSLVNHDVLKRIPNIIHMPRVVDRLEDIPLLARHVVLQMARDKPALATPFVRTDGRGYAWADIAQAMYLALMRMPFDGNVRDLYNVLRDAMKEHREPPLMCPEDMSRYRVAPSLPPPKRMRGGTADVMASLKGAEEDPTREQILAALEDEGWNVSRTADRLGVHRSKLIRLMDRYEIRRPKDDDDE